MKKILLLTMLGSMLAFESCNDDSPDYKVPTYNVGTTTINTDDYTGGGALKLLYSTDGGETWSESFENVYRGEPFMVKVNNGVEDLSADEFTFDWSGSSIQPSGDAIATFTPVNKNINVVVKVTDVMTLVTSHRGTGKFYSLDQTTGDTTYLFKSTIDASTLNDVRGFVYHVNQDLFYASTNSCCSQNGKLFTINPDTKVATMINANDGNGGAYEVWDAIVNWAVGADDSLIAVGDFNGDGNGIVKFGTDGGRSLKTAQADICCGLGMTYDATAGTLLVGNGWDTDNKEIEISIVKEDGTLVGSDVINLFEGFEEEASFTDQWLTLKAMAQAPDGKVYGLIFGYDLSVTYLVQIDIAAKTITNVKMIGHNNANQFNSLAFIPKHRL
jgi:hypothetical protein